MLPLQPLPRARRKVSVGWKAEIRTRRLRGLSDCSYLNSKLSSNVSDNGMHLTCDRDKITPGTTDRLFWITRRAALGVLASVQFVPLASAADYQIIDVPVGHAVDAYFQFNLSGKVYVRIETNSVPGCADFWWITWPLGRVQELG